MADRPHHVAGDPMSFSRWNLDGSDVYTFPAGDSNYECCACHLQGREVFSTLGSFLAHLDVHRRAGDTVPDYTYASARHWDAENPDGW